MRMLSDLSFEARYEIRQLAYLKCPRKAAAYAQAHPSAVEAIWATMPKDRPNQHIPANDCGNLGDGEVQDRATAAERGSRDLLRALLTYGVKHGLPNMTPDQCFDRLWGVK